jgi:hypothetical protein
MQEPWVYQHLTKAWAMIRLKLCTYGLLNPTVRYDPIAEWRQLSRHKQFERCKLGLNNYESASTSLVSPPQPPGET